jgi:hypothetical protein
MGGASSVLASEKKKPVDLSDLDGPEAIAAELTRLRALLQSINFEPPSNAGSAVASEEEEEEEEGEEGEADDGPDTEERAAIRKKRMGKTGPGTTRSGRKNSVMSGDMRIAMATTVGETRSDYAMNPHQEGTISQENSPMPPKREVPAAADAAAEALAAAASD